MVIVLVLLMVAVTLVAWFVAPEPLGESVGVVMFPKR
jgi:hypothetical protein